MSLPAPRVSHGEASLPHEGHYAAHKQVEHMSRSGSKRRRLSLYMLALGGLVTLGCSVLDPVPTPGAIRQAAVTDGSLTVIPNTTQTVNRYAALTAYATKGTNTVTVGATAAATLNVKAGDLVMLIQMQGASVASTDDAKFGDVTALNGAG